MNRLGYGFLLIKRLSLALFAISLLLTPLKSWAQGASALFATQALLETGSVVINHVPIVVVLDNSFENPVVFANMVSQNGMHETTVRVENIAN